MLDWDSRFFGFNVAQVRETPLNPASIEDILSWCEKKRVRCLYFLVPSEAQELQKTALKNGFKSVDERLTLSIAKISSTPPASALQGTQVRPFQREEKAALCHIAGQTHRGTRFFNDPEFSRSAAVKLYEQWMEACCDGDAQEIFVATDAAAPVGYLTCHRQSAGVGKIGLFGLLPSHQGRGLGKALMARALTWFRENRIEEVRVVTQGKNEPALRLYRSAGFSLKSRETWLHRWFKIETGPAARADFSRSEP